MKEFSGDISAMGYRSMNELLHEAALMPIAHTTQTFNILNVFIAVSSLKFKIKTKGKCLAERIGVAIAQLFGIYGAILIMLVQRGECQEISA